MTPYPSKAPVSLNEPQPSALSDLRVLDLTSGLGAYCTKLLADLGADVVRVEPPGGSTLRFQGSFYHQEPHPDRSLTWLFLNTNKRSITLDLQTSDGRFLLKRLAVWASVLVEDATPGTMDGLGLGYGDLKAGNPRLVFTSITPYGQTGPYAHYAASDLTSQAMGGAIKRVGWPDEPPNSTVGGQVANQVGSQAAGATLAAVYYRDLTGKGQQIDISAHEAMAVVDWDALPRYALGGGVIPRGAKPGEVRAVGGTGLHARRIWPAKDAKLRFVLIQTVTPQKEWQRFVEWLEEYGMADDLKGPDWTALEHRMAHLHHIEDVTERFLASIPARRAMDEGQAKGLQVMGYGRIHELLDDPQLSGEGFFVQVEHPELGDTLTYPGGPYRLSETPWRIRTTAPRVGEHNRSIYEGELGLCTDDIQRLAQAGVI